MARNRMVKPEFFEDEKIAFLSPCARLFFIGLWVHADDLGVFLNNSQFLKSRIYTYDDMKTEEIGKFLDELVQHRFIEFSVKNKRFGRVVNFLKHQKIDKPNYNNMRVKSEEMNEYFPNFKPPDAFKNKGSSDKADCFGDSSTNNRGGVGTLNRNRNRRGKKNLEIEGEINRRGKKNLEIEGEIENKEEIENTATRIFDFWVLTMKMESNRTKKTDKRISAVKNRLLQGYSEEELKNAIIGCSSSRFNMGKNENGSLYNDIELICRSAEKTDRYLSIFKTQNGKNEPTITLEQFNKGKI